MSRLNTLSQEAKSRSETEMKVKFRKANVMVADWKIRQKIARKNFVTH